MTIAAAYWRDNNPCSLFVTPSSHPSHPSAEDFMHRRAPPAEKKLQPIDAYKVLQIPVDATSSEIREAYRQLALWHHPGRSCGSVEERQRRIRIFNTLAACFETLMDSESRDRYDSLTQTQYWPTITLPLDDIHSCQKGGSDAPSYVDFCHGNEEIPKLVTSSSSYSTESIEDDVEKGPMGHILRARGIKSLSDPMMIFERVFGSRLFADGPDGRSSTGAVPLSPRSKSAWTGTCEILSDGTKVSRTSRILHNKRLTRIERVTMKDGIKQTHVTVESEEVEPQPSISFDESEEDDKEDSWVFDLCSYPCGYLF